MNANGFRSAGRPGRLTTAMALILLWFCAIGFVSAAEDEKAAARASLDRIRNLRKERPNDGILVFYEALLEVNLGERDSGLPAHGGRSPAAARPLSVVGGA